MDQIFFDLYSVDVRSSILLIMNIIIMESLLSIDNAAVLASMVMELPKRQRKTALFYGMVGAIGFRILCLILASFLLKIWWIEPIGGIYLFLLAINHFRKKMKVRDGVKQETSHPLFKKLTTFISPFIATVIMIQLMDLAFSIDNVLAVVAFTKNMSLIIIGVVIGIITMRFVATWFITLMERFPFLETSAFLIIGILGFKLSASLATHYYPDMALIKYLGTGGHVTHESREMVDRMFSLLTLLVFFVPIVTSFLFGIPRKHPVHHHEVVSEETL